MQSILSAHLLCLVCLLYCSKSLLADVLSVIDYCLVYVNSVTINAHRVQEGYLVYNEEAGQKLFRFMRQSLSAAPKLEGGVLRAYTRTFARLAPSFRKEQTLSVSFPPPLIAPPSFQAINYAAPLPVSFFGVSIWLCVPVPKNLRIEFILAFFVLVLKYVSSL